MSATVCKLLGGGDSWLYLIADGRILAASHHDNLAGMKRLYEMKAALSPAGGERFAKSGGGSGAR